MDPDRIFIIKDWRKLLKWESLEEKNRHHSEKSNTSHLYSSCLWVKSLNFHGEEKQTLSLPGIKQRRGRK